MNQNKKVILIPGWMNMKGMYGSDFEVLEVWADKLLPEKKIDADILIAHSLGCNWAVAAWEKNKAIRLILVNPLFPRRNIFRWFEKWREFHRKEKRPANKEVVCGLRNIIFAVKLCVRLLRKDFDATLSALEKDKITVLCGENDSFYCDKTLKDYLRSKNITPVEVPGVGHDWHEKFAEEIRKII